VKGSRPAVFVSVGVGSVIVVVGALVPAPVGLCVCAADADEVGEDPGASVVTIGRSWAMSDHTASAASVHTTWLRLSGSRPFGMVMNVMPSLLSARAL